MAQKLTPDEMRNVTSLAGFAAGEWKGIELWQYGDGEVIVSEGERAKEWYLLESGAVRVEHRLSGREGDLEDQRYLAMVVPEKGRLRAFGEMAYFLDGVRTATVRSVGASRVAKIGEEAVPALFQRYPEVSRELFAGLVEKLRETSGTLRLLQDRFDVSAEVRIVERQSSPLWRDAENPDRLYRVLSGSAIVEDGRGGRSTVLAEGPEAGFLNIREFLLERPLVGRALAEAGTFLHVIPRECRAAVVRNFPELALRVLREACLD